MLNITCGHCDAFEACPFGILFTLIRVGKGVTRQVLQQMTNCIKCSWAQNLTYYLLRFECGIYPDPAPLPSPPCKPYIYPLGAVKG